MLILANLSVMDKWGPVGIEPSLNLPSSRRSRRRRAKCAFASDENFWTATLATVKNHQGVGQLVDVIRRAGKNRGKLLAHGGDCLA